MGRRRFLDTLKSAGFSAGAIAGLSQESVAEMLEDDMVPHLKAFRHTNHEAVVQEGAAPVRERVYESIPREKWVRYRTAQQARRKIERLVSQYRQVDAAIGSRGSSRTAPETEITVVYTVHESQGRQQHPAIKREELSRMLPSSVTASLGEGADEVSRQFPVELRKEHQTPNAYYNSEYRPIPGGCQSQRGDGVNATLACVAYDEDAQSRVMLSAGHYVNGSASPSEHYQHSALFSDQFGEGEDYYATYDRDCGSIRFVNFEPSFDIAKESGSYRGFSLMGVLSQSELDKVKTDGGNLGVQGRTTGLDYGFIDWVSSTKVQVMTKSKGGDSGGPYFKKINDDEYYMAGIHAWNVDKENADDASRGNQITNIEEWLHVTV